MDVLDTHIIINYCADVLANHPKKSVEFTHSQVILTLVKKMKVLLEHQTQIFCQQRDKIGEVKVETPYEKRMREEKGLPLVQENAKTPEEV